MYTENNRLYGWWDTIVGLTTMYAAIAIPIEMGFKNTSPFFGLSNWLISLVFLMDFVINARKLRREKGKNESRKFEDKGWFQDVLLFADLLAAIPFVLFSSLPFFNLFRFFKLVRVYHMLRTYRHAMVQYAGIFTFFSFVFWIMISINGLACGWHAVGDQDDGAGFTNNYINALYWTVTTLTAVGYGDITPVTNLQKLYAIMVEILGFGVFTFIIGTVAGRLMRKDPATVRYQENIDGLAALLHYRSLPAGMRNRIVDFYRFIWRKRLGYDETSFLQSLPDSLRTEVALHLKKEVIEKVSLFSNASDEFKSEIALLLKPIFLVPGDYIFKAGDIGKEMYFVVNGELDALTRLEDQVLTKLEAGDFFGELALFKNQNRSATIKALSYCNIYALDKPSFDQVISRYPAIGKQLREKKYSDDSDHRN